MLLFPVTITFQITLTVAAGVDLIHTNSFLGSRGKFEAATSATRGKVQVDPHTKVTAADKY
jgi:hypothetical protein